MKFRTEIEPAPRSVRIGYDNRILTLGSCFAAHIAGRLAAAKFHVIENPSGILFNPLSIAAAIRSYAAPAAVTREELGFDGEVWYHFGFHGDFSAPTADEALRRMNAARQAGAAALRTADRVILTFGTAWVTNAKGRSSPTATVVPPPNLQDGGWMSRRSSRPLPHSSKDPSPGNRSC